MERNCTPMAARSAASPTFGENNPMEGVFEAHPTVAKKRRGGLTATSGKVPGVSGVGQRSDFVRRVPEPATPSAGTRSPQDVRTGAEREVRGGGQRRHAGGHREPGAAELVAAGSSGLIRRL